MCLQCTFIQIFVVASERRMCFETKCAMNLQGHPRSILAPIESAYATSYWSSIVTLSYLAQFQRYYRFPAENDPTPILSEFRGVPLGIDCLCCGSDSEDPKLIIRVINFKLVQPICPGYINVTDKRTDRRMTYDSNTKPR